MKTYKSKYGGFYSYLKMKDGFMKYRSACMGEIKTFKLCKKHHKEYFDLREYTIKQFNESLARDTENKGWSFLPFIILYNEDSDKYTQIWL